MLTSTLWPRSNVRIGLAMLLTGLLTFGLLILSSPGVMATSLVAPTAPADDAVAQDSELLRVVLATNEGPMNTDYILYIEQNVVLPDYHAGALLRADDVAEGSSAVRALRYDEIQFLHDDDGADGSSADRPLRYDEIKFLFDHDVVDSPSADRPLRYDEINFLHDNGETGFSTGATHESESDTNWLGLTDLELTDEPRLHLLVPPKVTSSDTNWLGITDLELIDEPRLHLLVPPR